MLELKMVNNNISHPQINVNVRFISKEYSFVDGSDRYVLINGSDYSKKWDGDVMFPNGADRVKVVSTKLTHPVKIPETVTKLIGTFSGCANFNQEVIIPDGVVNCSSMLFATFNFNRPVTIPDSVTDSSFMFGSQSGFNQNVTLSKNTNSCSQMFSSASFNAEVTIPEGVTNITGLLLSATTYNRPLNIPQGVTNCTGLFASCKTFDCPVEIPDSVTSCTSMFRESIKFNQPITIPNGVTECQEMFWLCRDFNQAVHIPESVTNCNYMFSMNGGSARIYVSDSMARNNAIVGNGMFNNAKNSRLDVYCPNVYLGGSSDPIVANRTASLHGICGNWNNSCRLNVHTSPQNFETMKQVSFLGGIPYSLPYTWTEMSGGVYNAQYNFYIYNDYEG